MASTRDYKTDAYREWQRKYRESGRAGSASVKQRIIEFTLKGLKPATVTNKLQKQGVSITQAKVVKTLARADVQEILNRQLVENQERIEGLYAKVLTSIESDLDNPAIENPGSGAAARKDYIALLKMHKSSEQAGEQASTRQAVGALSLAALSEAVKTLKDIADDRKTLTREEKVIELRQAHAYNRERKGPYSLADGDDRPDFDSVPKEDTEAL